MLVNVWARGILLLLVQVTVSTENPFPVWLCLMSNEVVIGSLLNISLSSFQAHRRMECPQ